MSEHEEAGFQRRTLVKGRYEVLKRLGQGMRGTVYLCRDKQLADRLVVLKVLVSGAVDDPEEIARFRDEVVALYDINHPFVVRAYEFITDESMIAMTMEYVNGGDLADLLSTGEQVPMEKILRLLNQIASGVGAIHKSRIIHHDLKPENILLTSSGDVKISDFGISRVSSVTKKSIYDDEPLYGTVNYLSPEYVQFGNVDARSDIYSIGIIGFELITNSIPFQDETAIKTLQNRLEIDPLPPHQLRRNCPLSLSKIITKALSRNPDERQQTPQELLFELAEVDVSMTGIALSDPALNAGDRPLKLMSNSAWLDRPHPQQLSFDRETGEPVINPFTSLINEEGTPEKKPISDKAKSMSRRMTTVDPLPKEVPRQARGPHLLLIILVWLIVITLGFVGFQMFVSTNPKDSVSSWWDSFLNLEIGENRQLGDLFQDEIEHPYGIRE